MPISQARMLKLIEIADFFKDREELVVLALQTFSSDPQGLSHFLKENFSTRPPSHFYEILGAEKKHFSKEFKKNEQMRDRMQKLRQVQPVTSGKSTAQIWEDWQNSPDFDPSELPPALRPA